MDDGSAEEGRTADDESRRRRSRRGVLAAVAAGMAGLAGCSAFTGATRGGPVDSGDLPDGGDLPEGLGGGGTTARPTTAAPTETPTPSATPTEAPAPTTEDLATPTVSPSEQVRVVETSVRVSDERVKVTARVRNVGSLVFSRLEVRLNLVYLPLGDADFVADFEYIDRYFEAPDDEDDRDYAASGGSSGAYFSPGEQSDFVARFSFPIDDRIRHRTKKYFEVGAVIRRWETADVTTGTTEQS